METLTAYLNVRPALWLSVLATILLFAVRYNKREATVPSTLPWVGRPTGPLAETRARYASFNNVRQWFAEGYAKVCVHTRREMCSSNHIVSSVFQAGKVIRVP